MISIFEIIILTPIFIIVLVVAFKTLQPALGCGRTHSFILAVCVSMLSMIGIVRYLKDFAEVLLLPYVVLVVAILLLLLFSFIGKCFSGSKDRGSEQTDRDSITDLNNKDLRR